VCSHCSWSRAGGDTDRLQRHRGAGPPTFVTRLLPLELVPAGIALNHVTFQAAMPIGPAVAGQLLAQWGVKGAYVLDAVAISVSLYGVAGLPRIRPCAATVSVQ
jgi:predicted MFS family arabinose efflux permease